MFRSDRVAPWLLAAPLLAVALAEIVLIIEVPGPSWPGVLYVLVGVEYLLIGALTWARRPANRTGLLLCLCAMATFTSALGNVTSPVLLGIGLILAEWPIAVLLHLVLAFPSGRLPDRRSRLLCAGGYLITLILTAPAYLFGGDGVPAWLHVTPWPEFVAVAEIVQRVITVLVIGASAVVLARRLRRTRPEHTRVLTWVSVYGVSTLLFFVLSANLAQLLGIGPLTLFVAQLIVFAGVPAVFAVVIIRGGFVRAEGLQSLTEWLANADGRRVSLTDALARALGDPSVELSFWLPETRTYVDPAGQASTPRSDDRRGSVDVELGGEHLGVIGYDRDLLADPRPVSAAGRVVALAVDRERMVAELLAGRAALRESLSRIVEAGDQERRRVARDLHDGLQGRLVVLAVRAGRLVADPAASPKIIAEAANLRTDAESAIRTLRELVQGIIPALLVDRGLYVATEDLIDRLPMTASVELPAASERARRLPTAIETAGYFTVAEAVANSIKHGRATRLEVRLRITDDKSGRQLRIEVGDDGIGGADPGAGSGLRGITDRIEAVGGRLQVLSPPGAGTNLVAEVPCGS